MKPRVRTSRRVPRLQDSDIDHEITLVDHDGSGRGGTPRPASPDAQVNESVGDDTDLYRAGSGGPLGTSDSCRDLKNAAAPISGEDGDAGEGRGANGDAGPADAPKAHANGSSAPRSALPAEAREQAPAAKTGAASQQTPTRKNTKKRQSARQSRLKDTETAIDILYENERGGFLCGIPLFSGAALGNLDPPAWTNANHRPSPTDIKTATPPDPSWQWAWPEWRVNHDSEIDADKDGWEYSFMFSKKFSWHGPRWWNSFVRRRAWIRRRVKKTASYGNHGDPHLLNPEYFSVEVVSKLQHPVLSGPSSVADGASRTSQCFMHEEDAVATAAQAIETLEDLMPMLRRLRIDREKLDAVENYLEHATDELLGLQEHMHEIMSTFVFQASRRLLLTRLMNIHDDAAKKLKQQQRPGDDKQKAPAAGDGAAAEEGDDLKRKVDNLAAAVKHADEEVRRLEYWSDVKGMAENGESTHAVDDNSAWQQGWEGVDQSGPIGANREQLP